MTSQRMIKRIIIQTVCVYGLLTVIAVAFVSWASSATHTPSRNHWIRPRYTKKHVATIKKEADIYGLGVLKQTKNDVVPIHDVQTKQVAHREGVTKHPPGEKCVKRLPQAIIVGIQKAGTGTLLTFLNDHPQIAACISPAEPKYFSVFYKKGLGWYKNLMPCSYSNQITIEKSPPYFYRRISAELIRKMNPRTKIIITVKEPIERAISMYSMMSAHSRKVRAMSFEDYVTSHERTIVKTTKTILEFSNYHKYMQYWLDNFGRKQILIVDGQKFIDDPSSVLKKVEKFLKIGSHFTPEKFVFNSTKGKHCLIPKSGVEKCMGSNKGHAHPSVSPDVTRLLQKYFKHKNEKFFEMIGMRFDWGY